MMKKIYAVLAVSSLFSVAGAALAAGGFDQFGYNRTARIFNGTGSSWCLQRGAPANCLGIYSPDKLVMKWNAEWDGKNGGSGAVWHYKIKWVGSCGAEYTPLPDGGYCIWGQFEVLMDQGQDPNSGPGHLWFAKALPNGYGAK